MKVQHIEKELPVGAVPYKKRTLSVIKQIVLHHTAGNGTPQSFAKFHVKPKSQGGRAYPGIAYHYLIDSVGTIFKCNSLDTISWHVANENTKSIGVCLIGNFETKEPTIDQINALLFVLESIRATVGELPLVGHRQRGQTLCPGKHLFALLEDGTIK